MLIEVFAPPGEAYSRMSHALEEIKKFLVPVSVFHFLQRSFSAVSIFKNVPLSFTDFLEGNAYCKLIIHRVHMNYRISKTLATGPGMSLPHDVSPLVFVFSTLPAMHQYITIKSKTVNT